MSLSNLHPDLNNPYHLWECKVGYDAINKKMIARIAYALHEVVELPHLKKSWTTVVRYMFDLESKPINIAVNGYYGTIRSILKDIKVIQYNGKQLSKGPNWDRFFSDYEDWSWFETSTNCGGYGKIVK